MDDLLNVSYYGLDQNREVARDNSDQVLRIA